MESLTKTHISMADLFQLLTTLEYRTGPVTHQIGMNIRSLTMTTKLTTILTSTSKKSLILSMLFFQKFMVGALDTVISSYF